MTTRILSDFHHLSLYNSLVRLFGQRLGMNVYRPIGWDWYNEGFWDVYDHPDTVEQYLGMAQEYVPPDGTPPLNGVIIESTPGVYLCKNPETQVPMKAVTLEWFKSVKFDYVIASIPQHVERFRKLIKKYNPDAKLIVQIGNMWDSSFPDDNLLCSVHPSNVPYFKSSHAVSYHQEFDLSLFYPTLPRFSGSINSYINNIERYAGGGGWRDFVELEKRTNANGLTWKSYGGQCRDGSLVTSSEVAHSISDSSFVFHVKPGGDGYGHIIHNAFAMGRPVVTRRSDYEGSWGGELMVPGSYIDLDQMSYDEAAATLLRLLGTPDELNEIGKKASDRFLQVVDFDREEMDIRSWLEGLR